MLNGPGQQREINTFEQADDEKFLVQAGFQKVGTQHGGNNNSRQQRSKQSKREGERHGTEHNTFSPLQSENRQHNHDYNANRESDRAADFARGFQDNRNIILPGAAFIGVKMAEDIFDHNNRTVREHTDRDCDAAQGHQISGHAGQAHTDNSDESTERQRQRDNNGRAEITQEDH